MGRLAIIFGVLLTLLGIVFFAIAEPGHHSPTALIPAAFGVPLIILGVLARQEKLRMHVMHVAALLGIVGCLVPTYLAISKLSSGEYNPKAVTSQIIMAILCGIFTALCVKSFIDARRRRKANVG